MKCLFGYTSNCQNERLETEVSLIVLFSHKNRQVVVWGIDRSPCTYLRLWHSVHLLMLRFRSLTATVDIYLNSEKVSRIEYFPRDTRDRCVLLLEAMGRMQWNTSSCSQHEGKCFGLLTHFFYYPILFETSFPFSPHNFKHFFFTYAGYIMFVTWHYSNDPTFMTGQ